MHKININLHNLKTALIFSMEISWDYSSRHGYVHVRAVSTKFFVAPRPRSEGGGGGGVESTLSRLWDGVKRPGFLGG